MNDMNRVLIFLLLIGLLYALYKYQHIIFGDTIYSFDQKPQQTEHPEHPRIKHTETFRETKQITADNISQVSIASLENDDGDNNDHELYKNDSLLGSLDTGSLNLTENGSINSSFFFK